MKIKIFRRILLLIIGVMVLCSLTMPCYAYENYDSENVVRVGWYDGNDIAPDEAAGAHGYDYEYLQALSQYTGWTYEYVGGTWNECLLSLENGEIDILGFVSKTDERETKFGYPTLPMACTNAWLVIDSNNAIDSVDPSAIDGMTVGIAKGNAYNDIFKTYCRQNDYTVNYVEFDLISDISPALENGEIDAAVVSDEDMTSSERGYIKLASNNQYYVTNIDNQELLQELDDAMIQVNTYCPYLNSDLYRKYLSTNISGKPVFTAAEEAFIEEHPTILVSYDTGWPPVEYYDETIGDYVGISPDIFQLLSEKTGINFVYEGSTSGQVLKELQNEDNKNVLTTISYDYAWADRHNVYITQPFITSSIVKFGKNIDAENPTVAINEKAYFTYLLQDELEGVNTLQFAKQSERLEAVRTGKADYTFMTEDQANYYRSIPKYSDFKTQNMVGYEQSICISVSKNSDKELISILSKALSSISHDELVTIIMRNTVNSYDMTLKDVFYEYRVPTIIISILLIAVIAALIMQNATKRKSKANLQAAYEQEQTAYEKMKEALAIAEKASSAKGEFMSRMSHEIRTPLNALIGYNTIAKNAITKASTEEERRQAGMNAMDCLTKSELASRHLLTVINDVLDMSAIENGKIKVVNERFDFKNLISSLTVLFYSQAKAKDVKFEVLFDSPTEEWFVGDQMRINQILTNLLSNAVKFTPEGGQVTMSIIPEIIDEKRMTFQFKVSDTGIGMEKDFLENLWKPFEQADPTIVRRFGGTGLGLSITKSLVDIMEGAISVESQPGAGSTFTVELTVGRTEQPSKSKSYDFSGINALVVDNDQSTCDYIKLLFDRCGARCMTVTSGMNALELFSKNSDRSDPFTLCMVDWRMPQMDGIETIRRIRKISGPDIPIIIVTAYDFSEIAEKVKDIGISLFVAKPLFQSSLFDLLATISGNQSPQKVEKSVTTDFHGARVLLAEDNKMNMEVAQRILESAGLIVDSAWNGNEAVSLFTNAPAGTYKVILMDVHMPEMDGYQATQKIRASDHPEAATIPIIAMTADAFAENVAEAYAAGMNDHLAKPIDIQGLFETLQKYIPNSL